MKIMKYVTRSVKKYLHMILLVKQMLSFMYNSTDTMQSWETYMLFPPLKKRKIKQCNLIIMLKETVSKIPEMHFYIMFHDLLELT
jgi:hypothetical protein